MPKLNFPASPLVDTLYTENGNTWKWNGTSWISYNSLDLTSQVSGALGMTYGGTGYSSNSKGDILVGTGSSWYKLTYSASANDVLTVDTAQPAGLKWAPVPPAAATSVQVSSTNQNSIHYPTFVDALTGSGLALSTDSALFYNPSSNVFNVGGLGVSQNASIGQTLLIYDTASLNYIGFKAGSLVGSTTFTLPLSSPAIGNSVLQSTSDGILSWVPMVASGGGSGNVFNGNQGQLAYYFAPGTGVTGSNNLSYDENTSTLTTNTFSGNLSATAATATNFYGTLKGTADAAKTVSMTNTAENNSFKILFANAVIPPNNLSGIAISFSSNIDYNPSTDILTVGQVSGNLSGTSVTASSSFYGPLSGTASTAKNVYLTSGSNNSNHYLAFTELTFPFNQGGYGLSVNSAIYYNPSTDVLTVGQVSGNLSGTLVTASSGFYGNLIGTATTSQNVNIRSSTGNSTNYLVFTPSSNSLSGVGLSVVSTVTLNPSTNALSLDTGSLTANGVKVGSSSNTINTVSGNLTLDSNGGTVNINDNLTVQGNLNVQGTTTTIDSTVTTFLDPVIVLGSGAGNTHSTVDDNKDRGVEFRYADSGTAITGFFGYKDDTKFYYIPNANIASDGVYTGIAGTIVANLEGFATTSQNIVLSPASTNSSHRIVFTPNNSSAGSALSTNSTLVYNPSTDILSVSGLSITSPLPSTSTTTGALVVAGGVGIGDSLFTNTGSKSSISGVEMQNSVISQGVWQASTIDYPYGGTGYSSYNKGDILVGYSGLGLSKLAVGPDRSLIVADSASSFGVSWQPLLTPNYGAFASTTSQTVLSAAGTTVISFDTIFAQNNITITPIGAGLARTTRIYFSESGIFNIQFSAQLNLTDATQTKQGEIWFRKNGLDVPTSNTRINVPGKDLESVLTVNFVDSFIPGNYIELAMYGETSDFGIGAFPESTSPYIAPAIPSVITTVTQVSNIIPGSGIAITGIAQINNQTGASQTLVVGTTGSDFNINSASNIHTFNLPDAGSTVRGVLNTSTQTIAGSKTFANNLIVSSSTNSESTTTGALTINGGLGLTGNAFIGGTTTSIGNIYAPLFEGNVSATAITSNNFYGSLVGTATTATNVQLHSASTNSSHRLVFTPNDATSGVALSTNTTLIYNPSTDILSVSGAAVTSTTASTSTTSGALIISGGLGLAGNAFIGGTVTASTFTGNLSATAATSTNFYGTLVGIASTATNTNLVLDTSASGNHPITFTPVSSSVAGGAQSFSSAVYIVPSTGNITATSFAGSLTGNVTGYATTGRNVSINSASTNAVHSILFTPSGLSAGSALSSDGVIVYNPSTDILSTSGLAVTSSTFSSSTTTGALIVTGGVGVGATLTANVIRTTGNMTVGSLTSGNVVLSGTGGSLFGDSNFTYSAATDSISLTGTNSTTPNLVVSKSIAALSKAPGIRLVNTNVSNLPMFSPELELTSGTWSTSAGSAFTARVLMVAFGNASDEPTASFFINYEIDRGIRRSGLVYERSFIYGIGTTASDKNGALFVPNRLDVIPYSVGVGATSAYTSLLLRHQEDLGGISTYWNSPALTFVASEKFDSVANVFTRQYVQAGSAVSRPIWLLELGTQFDTANYFTNDQITPTLSISAERLGPFTVHQLIGATSTSYASLVSLGGLAVSSNAMIGGTTRITDTSFSTSSSTGALVVLGGVGIGGSIYSGGNINVGSGYELRVFEPTNTNYAGFKYTGATQRTYTLPSDFPSSGTANSVLSSTDAGILSWIPMSSGASGSATTSSNINIISATSNTNHSLLFTPAVNSAGSAISANSTLVYNPSTDILSVSGLAVTSTNVSSSTTSGALIVSGGLGLAGNAFIGGTINVSQPINIQNGGTNASSFGQSSGFVLYDGALDKLTAGSGASVTPLGYWTFNSRVYASSFFANNQQMPNGAAGSGNQGRLTYWTGINTISGAAGATWDNTNSILRILGTTNSSSTSTGTLIIDGGIGVSANAFIGGTVNITNTTQATYGSTTSGALVVNGGVGIGGSVYIGGQLGVGTTLGYNAVNVPAYFVSSVNSYSQIISHNKSNGDSASSDFVVSNDLSSDTAFYGDFGMNSSGWAATTSAYNTANAVYLVSNSGDLAIGSLSDNPIRFFYKNDVNDAARIYETYMTVLYGTNSASTTSGALTVVGGLGITGNAFIGGTVTATTFTGNFSGTAATVTNFYGALVGTASTSNNVSLLLDTSASGNHPITFTPVSTTVAGGAQSFSSAVYVTPSTGNITATSFAGSLTGNVTGYATTARNVSVITASTNTSHPILFTPISLSAGSAISSDGVIVYNPSTNILSISGLAITSTISSNSTSSGALIVSGGLGLAGNAFIGGTVVLSNATNSTTASTGALTINGGAGFGQSVSVGGRLQLFNSSLYTAFVSSQSGISTVYTLPATTPAATGTSVLSSTQDGTMSWVPLTSGGSGSGSVGSGTAPRMAYYSTSGTAVTDTYGINYNLSGTASTFTIFGGASSGSTVFSVHATSATSVRVGIGVSNPAYALEVDGEISATSKSFVIDHPTKPGMKLRYGSLEGPENGVYIRGILKDSYIIETPDYWKGLVDPESFTVNLTPIGIHQQLFVEKIEDYKVYVGTAGTSINCYFYVMAERKDVEKLTVEY